MTGMYSEEWDVDRGWFQLVLVWEHCWFNGWLSIASSGRLPLRLALLSLVLPSGCSPLRLASLVRCSRCRDWVRWRARAQSVGY